MSHLNSNELQTASRFLFLSMAKVVIEQDRKHVTQGDFKIKEPYIELLERMAAEATKERRQLRVIMNRRQITVSVLHKNDSFSSFLFICRGKEEKQNYYNPAIRKKVEMIIKELMTKSLSPEHLHVSSNL